jgi:hypothetical protein
MKTILTTDDQIVLQRLLTELATRAEGAVDFWPLVCIGLENFLFDPHRFLTENTEILHSLTIVLRAILAKAGWADEEPICGSLQQMNSAVTQLREAFAVLEQFRTVALGELQRATEALAESHSSLRQAIGNLGAALRISVALLQDSTLDYAESVWQFPEQLFHVFLNARSATPKPMETEIGSH